LGKTSKKEESKKTKTDGPRHQKEELNITAIAASPDFSTLLLFFLFRLFRGLLFLDAFGRFLGFFLGVFALAHDRSPSRLSLSIDADNSPGLDAALSR